MAITRAKNQRKNLPILFSVWDVSVDSMYKDVSVAIGAKSGIR
jgi:hypothetical protein